MSEPLLCTIAETAALLRVSRDTVKRQIAAGIIPIQRIRRNIRISREWLNNYVAERAPILLTRRQTSAKLGVSVRTITTLQRKGLLPTVTVGEYRMVPAAAVAEYVKRNSFAFLRPVSAATRQSGTSGVPVPAVPRHPVSSVPVPVQPRRVTFSNVRGV